VDKLIQKGMISCKELNFVVFNNYCINS